MKAAQIKQNQVQIKSDFESNPNAALQSLSASGDVDFENLSFHIQHPDRFSPAGVHASAGGDGNVSCPVEIMLASWASCFGVTLAAVAHSMELNISACRILVTCQMDFKGTLAIDKSSPVGLTAVDFNLAFQSSESEDSLKRLVQLSERFCVVHQTMLAPPTPTISFSTLPNPGDREDVQLA